MKRSIAVAWVAVAFVAWVGGCTDSPGPGDIGNTDTDPLNVSNPVQSVAFAPRSAAVSGAAAAGTDFAYVSLTPGTIPTGENVSVRNSRTGNEVFAPMADGGFDPVPVIATAGDALDFTVRVAGQASPLSFRRVVPLRASPIVVRTYPPPRKRDVALNAAIIIVFSEPIDKSTLTGTSVQLFRGTTAVAGAVTVLQGSGSAVAFVPTAPLARNTDYQLVVTQGVRDRDGDALDAGASVAFTTGTSSTGPPASIDQSVDTIRMTGTTYQLTATVRDAAGNILIDQPVTWATYDPGITVSQTGLVSALVQGIYVVSASLGDLIAWTYVGVVAGPPASVEVSPTSATVSAADTVMLHATVRDAAGHLLVYFPDLSWISSDPAFATVALTDPGTFGSTVATVTGVSPGSVTITATTGTASGTAAVAVGPRAPVASVTVTPGSATLVPQGTMQLVATLRDANGKVLFPRPTTWTSDNAAVATVSASGLVTAVSVGSAVVTATSEGVSDYAGISVTLLTFRSVTTGDSHYCGLTTIGTAWCWGQNNRGQLGNGSTTGFGTVSFTLVVGGLTFAAVSAGFYHTCALTTTGAAYCWGANDFGQLGDGSTVSSSVPVAVSGGHAFVAISAGGGYLSGSSHTCAVTTTGAAYCWGSNVGDGSTVSSSVPVAVSGGLTFAAVSAGAAHTCGVTTTGAAYCWGSNDRGQLGDGSTVSSSVPVAVTGGLTFSALDAGGRDYGGHSCAVTTGGLAYCWGDNEFGQLGDGSGISSSVPVAVTGGLTFSMVSAGGSLWSHTCGVTTGGAGYCWGNSGYDTANEAPVLVPGGLSFASVSAGAGSCGVTVDNIAYCWHDIGSVPVKVAGQP